jgi:tetratricopeptide (TPR) repeat protein
VSTGTRPPDVDVVAELEEERRFLLQSLRDLDREYAAGDVDEADYQTLKDGYTVRAAAVLRQIEEGRAALGDRPPRNWGKIAVVTAAVLLAAVGIGLALGAAWGERGVGQEITGRTPGDEARAVLASARSALSTGEMAEANALYAAVIEMERERGEENSEAITYFGWTLGLLSRQVASEEEAAELVDAAVVALETAIEIDPDYADPQCFMGIVQYSFNDDPVAALPYIEECEASNPPRDVATLVANFAEEVRTAAE